MKITTEQLLKALEHLHQGIQTAEDRRVIIASQKEDDKAKRPRRWHDLIQERAVRQYRDAWLDAKDLLERCRKERDEALIKLTDISKAVNAYLQRL